MSLLQELQSTFERVSMKHHTQSRRSRQTRAALLKDEVLHIGIASVHYKDQFSRKKGATIALGRALTAYEIYIGKQPNRAGPEAKFHYSSPLSGRSVYDALTAEVFLDVQA